MPLHITGSCLCGALGYAATEAPRGAGYCCCKDCRKASGSGFIPFMGFRSSALSFSGSTRQVRSPAHNGNEAVRNFCPSCGGLVFGGEIGIDTSHTIYAGSLDDPTVFKPTMVIFNRDKPDWVILPDGLKVFETMPG